MHRQDNAQDLCTWRMWTVRGRNLEERFLELGSEHIQNRSDVRADKFETLTELRSTFYKL